MEDFSQAARSRRDALLEELDSLNERKLVLETQVQGLNAYLHANVSEKNRAALESMQKSIAFVPMPVRRAFAAKKDLVATAVENLLRMKQPQHTRELLEYLANENIDVGGSDKILSLSSILSRDGRFEASRKDGWSLKEKSSTLEDVEDLV